MVRDRYFNVQSGNIQKTDKQFIVKTTIPPPILQLDHVWLMDNVKNPTSNIITSIDNGLVGGLHLSNPSLANKPTQTTLINKTAYQSDFVDDILTRNVTDFGRNYTKWVCHIALNYNPNFYNFHLSAFNTNNSNAEGFAFRTSNGSPERIQLIVWDSAGNYDTALNFGTTLGDYNNYLWTIVYTGTHLEWWYRNNKPYSIAKPNPLLIPSSTTNLSMFGEIRTSSETLKSGAAHQGLVAFGEYIDDATTLSNINIIKNYFGYVW